MLKSDIVTGNGINGRQGFRKLNVLHVFSVSRVISIKSEIQWSLKVADSVATLLWSLRWFGPASSPAH